MNRTPQCDCEFSVSYSHDKTFVSELTRQLRESLSGATTTSGLLNSTPPQISAIKSRDGQPGSLACDQATWQQIYLELSAAVLEAPTWMSPTELQAHARYHRGNGHTPIMVAHVSHHAVRARFWHYLEQVRTTRQSVTFPDSREIIEHREAFCASAILERQFDVLSPQPFRHYGRRVSFVLPKHGIRLHDVESSATYEIDFGDGQGLRSIQVDQPIVVEYPDYGRKMLTLLRCVEKRTLHAHFSLDIAESTAPQPNELWNDLMAQKPYKGVYAQGRAWVYYGSEHGVRRSKLVRPVIVAEGFPGGYTLDYLWDRLNQHGLAGGLLASGYDLVILGFKDGRLAIQANALLMQALIQKVSRVKESDTPIVVGGASMGGLVARAALADMEHENVRHNVAKFFTVDTPHNGANVPLSLQAMFQFLKSRSDSAREVAELLSSPAAQQLLMSWVRPFPGARPSDNWPDFIGSSPLRDELYEWLDIRGWMPKRLETAAVACGIGTGAPNGDQPSMEALAYECAACHWAHAYVYPRGGVAGQEYARFRDDDVKPAVAYKIMAGANPAGYDSAPGGLFTVPVFKEAYDGIAVPATQKWLHVQNACFVPTTSALSCRASDLYTPITRAAVTEFDRYELSSPANLLHIELTAKSAAFLSSFITDLSPVTSDA